MRNKTAIFKEEIKRACNVVRKYTKQTNFIFIFVHCFSYSSPAMSHSCNVTVVSDSLRTFTAKSTPTVTL
jgi:sialic acid synthase SpsE